MAVNTEAAILDRLLEDETMALPREAAEFILKLDFKEPDHARMAISRGL